jgi:predicted ATPase
MQILGWSVTDQVPFGKPIGLRSQPGVDLILGVNGSGKTKLLEAAVAAHGGPEGLGQSWLHVRFDPRTLRLPEILALGNPRPVPMVTPADWTSASGRLARLAAARLGVVLAGETDEGLAELATRLVEQGHLCLASVGNNQYEVGLSAPLADGRLLGGVGSLLHAVQDINAASDRKLALDFDHFAGATFSRGVDSMAHLDSLPHLPVPLLPGLGHTIFERYVDENVRFGLVVEDGCFGINDVSVNDDVFPFVGDGGIWTDDGLKPEVEEFLVGQSTHATDLLAGFLPGAPQLRLELASQFQVADGHPLLRWVFVRDNTVYDVEQGSTAEIRWARIAIKMAERVNLVADPRDASNTLTLVLDEPERGLHPTAIRHLAKTLEDADGVWSGMSSRPLQFLIATHSPHIMNVRGARRWRCASFPDGAELLEVDEDATTRILNLGLMPADILAFARAIVLVEGHHDELVLRHTSETSSFEVRS